MPETPGEFELIDRLFAPLTAGAPNAYGLTDDAAVISPPEGHELVVTTDTLVAGVHFLANDPPASVAAKLLAVNFSDLAAMGAVPQAFTLAAAWPRNIATDWIAAFAAGLAEHQNAAGAHLIGGDTVATPGPMTLTATAFGSVEMGCAIRRNGARPGDLLYVSGTIGDAALGLKILTGEISIDVDEADQTFLIDRYRQPTARVELGQAIVPLASAALDISDGLIADVGHIAAQSNVMITIDASCIPMSSAAHRLIQTSPECAEIPFNGGDDYELAFTVPSNARRAIEAIDHLRLTEVGKILAVEADEPTVVLLDQSGNPVEVGRGGYRHF